MNVRRAIPLLIQEGWTRHQKEVAKPPLTERTGWSGMEPLLKMHSETLRQYQPPRLRRCGGFASFFLMAQPPLLCQEGSSRPDTHSLLHRPRLQQIRHYLDTLLSKEGGRAAAGVVC